MKKLISFRIGQGSVIPAMRLLFFDFENSTQKFQYTLEDTNSVVSVP